MTSLVLELSAFFAVAFFVVAKCNHCPTINWKGVHPNTLVKNVKNETRVFATVTGVDLKGCIDNCQRRKVCQYINYYTAAHLCFLVEKLNGTMTEANKVNDDKHFVFGNKSEWAQEKWGQKYSVCRNCSERQLCTIEKNGPPTCTIKECPAPPVVDDAELLGNQYYIGSRLLYLCNTTKKSHGIVCQPNGTWSTIESTYCQESMDTDEQTTTAPPTTTTEQTTTAPPTPTTEQVTCPTLMQPSYTKLKVDDTQFQFMIVENEVTKDQAMKCCTKGEGQLVQILHDVTMNALIWFLSTRPFVTGNNKKKYWIDANRENINNSPWKTKDGKPVVVNDDYWKDDLKHNCAHIHGKEKWLHDGQCDDETRAFICERS